MNGRLGIVLNRATKRGYKPYMALDSGFPAGMSNVLELAKETMKYIGVYSQPLNHPHLHKYPPSYPFCRRPSQHLRHQPPD